MGPKNSLRHAGWEAQLALTGNSRIRVRVNSRFTATSKWEGLDRSRREHPVRTLLKARVCSHSLGALPSFLPSNNLHVNRCNKSDWKFIGGAVRCRGMRESRVFSLQVSNCFK
jgi:hypothetical protein